MSGEVERPDPTPAQGFRSGGRLLALLGGANVASVALAAALVPMIMGTQLAAGLLLRLGALRSYGRATMAGAALQLAVLVALEARPGLSPELALTASLAGASLTTAGLAVALARRA